MTGIKIFENPQFGSIRSMEVDGDPWFVGSDVAKALGYKNSRAAIKTHVDADDKGCKKIYTPGGMQTLTIINESGLYAMTFGSELPNARQFKRWVTSEVIPSIRRHGGYLSGQETMTDDELLAKALQVAQNKLAERERRISSLEVEVEIARPKADYFDQLVDRNTLTNFRETAKQLEVPPRKFVDFLLARKYIYRDKKGKLLPYEDKNTGLFEVKECFNEKTNWSGTQTLVTPKGRETFRLLYVN